MGVLLIILGLLLMLFGGGCTLILAGIESYNPSNIMNDLADFLPMWLGLGLLPLAAGFFLFRAGLKLDRERRNAKVPKDPN
jgi:hypothetical protein